MRNIENLTNKVFILQLCISQIKTAFHLTQNLRNCCSNDRITCGATGRGIFESLSNALFVGQKNTDDIVLRTRYANNPVKLTIFGEPHQSPPVVDVPSTEIKHTLLSMPFLPFLSE